MANIYSVATAVEVVGSGGVLVRQVDTNGVALDDATYSYGIFMPVMPVDSSGVNEDSTRTFSTHMKITLSNRGIAVLRVQPDGTAINTALGTVSPTLAALAFDTTTFTNGTPSSGIITGATATSTIVLSGGPTGLTINSGARTWDFDGTGAAGSGTFDLIETLAGATNTPRTTNLGYIINSGVVGSGFVLREDGSFVLREDGSKIIRE